MASFGDIKVKYRIIGAKNFSAWRKKMTIGIVWDVKEKCFWHDSYGNPMERTLTLINKQSSFYDSLSSSIG